MNEKIRKRIAKLLAMASSSTHMEEASSFATKARELMDEHSISLGDAVAEENPLGTSNHDLPYAQREYRQMATAVARFFGCDLTWTPGTNTVTFYGREAARTTASLMLPYWTVECRRLGNELAKKTTMNRREAIHSVMDEFTRRLYKLAYVSPAKAVHSSLPVPLDEASALVKGNTRLSDAVLRNNSAARALAGTISVSDQVTSDPKALKIC